MASPATSITAIVIGVLLMKNIKPGPEIFEKQAVLVYSTYLVFILANLVLIPIGLIAIKLGGIVVRVPKRVLLPIILLFCVIGAYAINGSYFDVWVMLGMGVLGFGLERWSVPLGPVVLGIILGGPLEERFIQTLTGADSVFTAFLRPPHRRGTRRRLPPPVGFDGRLDLAVAVRASVATPLRPRWIMRSSIQWSRYHVDAGNSSFSDAILVANSVRKRLSPIGLRGFLHEIGHLIGVFGVVE